MYIVTPWVASVSVCVGASQRIPLSVLARNLHKGPLRETGSGRGKEGANQQKGAEEISRLERAVKRRRTQSTEVSMASGYCGSFARVHARVSSQNAQKMSRNPPFLRLELTHVVFVRLFFSSTLSVVFCVSVKKCVIPLGGDEINH